MYRIRFHKFYGVDDGVGVGVGNTKLPCTTRLHSNVLTELSISSLQLNSLPEPSITKSQFNGITDVVGVGVGVLVIVGVGVLVVVGVIVTEGVIVTVGV